VQIFQITRSKSTCYNMHVSICIFHTPHTHTHTFCHRNLRLLPNCRTKCRTKVHNLLRYLCHSTREWYFSWQMKKSWNRMEWDKKIERYILCQTQQLKWHPPKTANCAMSIAKLNWMINSLYMPSIHSEQTSHIKYTHRRIEVFN